MPHRRGSETVFPRVPRESRIAAKGAAVTKRLASSPGFEARWAFRTPRTGARRRRDCCSPRRRSCLLRTLPAFAHWRGAGRCWCSPHGRAGHVPPMFGSITDESRMPLQGLMTRLPLSFRFPCGSTHRWGDGSGAVFAAPLETDVPWCAMVPWNVPPSHSLPLLFSVRCRRVVGIGCLL